MINDGTFKILVNGNIWDMRGQNTFFARNFFPWCQNPARNFRRLEKKPIFQNLSGTKFNVQNEARIASRSKFFEHFFVFSLRQPETWCIERKRHWGCRYTGASTFDPMRQFTERQFLDSEYWRSKLTEQQFLTTEDYGRYWANYFPLAHVHLFELV